MVNVSGSGAVQRRYRLVVNAYMWFYVVLLEVIGGHSGSRLVLGAYMWF